MSACVGPDCQHSSHKHDENFDDLLNQGKKIGAQNPQIEEDVAGIITMNRRQERIGKSRLYSSRGLMKRKKKRERQNKKAGRNGK